MNICIPKERRPNEYRVGLSPVAVEMLCQQGHNCFVEHHAGVGAGFSDREYEHAGAKIVYSPEEAFGRGDLVVTIARPKLEELDWVQPGAILMGFLHLPGARQESVDILISKGITGIAYEQIEGPEGCFPVLRVSSQIGGLMVAQTAARLLQNNWGGKGILLGGVPGVPPAEVVVIGAGTVGTYAAQSLLGMGAHVTVIDISLAALQRIADRCPGVTTMISIRRNIERALSYADVVVGAVRITGQQTPMLVTREMLKLMKSRSILMDVSIDDGGCFETSRPTTYENPTFVEEGIVHYCVPNIPGAVARTATHALINAAMPFILEITGKGLDAALEQNPGLEKGVQLYQGQPRHLSHLTHKGS
jgi:alanine dehydrogenase